MSRNLTVQHGPERNLRERHSTKGPEMRCEHIVLYISRSGAGVGDARVQSGTSVRPENHLACDLQT